MGIYKSFKLTFQLNCMVPNKYGVQITPFFGMY
jgi:hypothetical protein